MASATMEPPPLLPAETATASAVVVRAWGECGSGGGEWGGRAGAGRAGGGWWGGDPGVTGGGTGEG